MRFNAQRAGFLVQILGPGFAFRNYLWKLNIHPGSRSAQPAKSSQKGVDPPLFAGDNMGVFVELILAEKGTDAKDENGELLGTQVPRLGKIDQGFPLRARLGVMSVYYDLDDGDNWVTVPEYTKTFSHNFHGGDSGGSMDWGFSKFVDVRALEARSGETGALEDPSLETGDDLLLTLELWYDESQLPYDSKAKTGYVGLDNQGATCYMNSLLQSLFHLQGLRKSVYSMPTQDAEKAGDASVALALQRVFYNLQYGETSVTTKELTKAFGWDSMETFTQHDVQELLRLLLDNLEEKMKKTEVSASPLPPPLLLASLASPVDPLAGGGRHWQDVQGGDGELHLVCQGRLHVESERRFLRSLLDREGLPRHLRLPRQVHRGRDDGRGQSVPSRRGAWPAGCQDGEEVPLSAAFPPASSEAV